MATANAHTPQFLVTAKRRQERRAMTMLFVCAITLAAIASQVSFVSLIKATAGQDPKPAASPFSAVVKPERADFSLPVPSRRRWIWRRPETKANAQEYRMDVTVVNNGKPYTFGFYLWKRSGAPQSSGDLESLIMAGQKSVFERAASGHMTIIHDAGIKVKVNGELLTITIRGRDNVATLFSSRPSEATFKINIPEEPQITEKLPIDYQD